MICGAFIVYFYLRVRDPSLNLSHYISTLVILLPDRDLNSCANPEPQLKVQCVKGFVERGVDRKGHKL